MWFMENLAKRVHQRLAGHLVALDGEADAPELDNGGVEGLVPEKGDA